MNVSPRVEAVLEQVMAALAAGDLTGNVPIYGPPLTPDEIRAIEVFLEMLGLRRSS